MADATPPRVFTPQLPWWWHGGPCAICGKPGACEHTILPPPPVVTVEWSLTWPPPDDGQSLSDLCAHLCM